MPKALPFLKKTLKVILWIIISFLLLFTVVAILIQVPAIQNKITQYATSYVSNKTHTKVGLKKISISFPKSILIEGLYLEDLQKDTLLYAGEAKINIAFRDLFRRQIHISSFTLNDVNLQLSRKTNDSLFNYNFLVTAFSDSTKKEEAEPKEPSKWTFGLDDVRLKNIRLRYNDAYGGTDMAANLQQLHLTMDELDLAKSIFSIDELEVDRLTASVLLLKSNAPIDTTTSKNTPPTIIANKIRIRNTSFRFGDSLNKQTLFAGITQLQLKDGSVDLGKQTVAADEVALSTSKIQYSKLDIPPDSTVVVVNEAIVKNKWTVAVKNINLDDNSLAYDVPNKPKAEKVFDAAHMDYRHVSLKAKNFWYSPDKTAVSVKKFSSIDQNGFAVLKFETDFVMDQHSITTKNSKLKTNGSSMDADLGMRYSSLAALKDSLPYMIVNADMHKMRVLTSEVLYFVPQLAKQDFFKNKNNISTVSGTINGPINNLRGENMVISTGTLTMVKTDFTITGLPEAETAYFNFPNLRVSSGKKDIGMMAGKAIPKSIDLPENISMQIAFRGQLKAFESTMGMSSSYGSAHMFARLDKKENFSSKATIDHFDLGRLLKNREMFGPVSLTAETSGHGLDKNTITAKVKANVTEIYLNKYMYHRLHIDGAIAGQKFEGKIDLDDKNAEFTFDGLVNLNPKQEEYKFYFDLKAADLQKLHLTESDIRISLVAESDLKGGSVNEVNGKAGITKIYIAHEEKEYLLDSVLFASINEKNRSEFSLNSALIGLTYNGTFSPIDLSKQLGQFANNYFPLTEPKKEEQTEPQRFNVEIQLHNHPILSDVFLPQLKEFEPGLITGSFDSEKSELVLKADMRRIVYGTTEINNLALNVNSDVNALNYSFAASKISQAGYKLDNVVLDGALADSKLTAGISSVDEDQNKKLLVRSLIVKEEDSYKLTLDTANFYLMNNRWNIAGDNYIAFGKKGFLIHHLLINKAESEILVASVHDRFNDDLNIEIKNFQLNDISRIIEKDTSLIQGVVDGNILLKRVDSTYGLIADAKISNLIVREVPVGTLTVKAVNPTAQRFDIDVSLSGSGNNLSATGYFVPKGGDQAVHLQTDIQSLSLKTVEAFSMGQITEGSGNMSGNFLVEGKATEPDITGEIIFHNAGLRPKVLNNHLLLRNETIQLKKDGIYFNSFTIADPDQHTAVINGSVKMQHFKNFVFDMQVNTADFLLFNTTSKDNEQFYGRMIIDSKIDVSGPMTLPVINARVKMKDGSNFTFAVPEKRLTTDKGEGIVVFEDTIKINPILVRDEKKQKESTGITGFDISSIIEIDKDATLRLMLDPSSTDSLVVKGDAALSFAIDRSGKMTLTGAYHLNDGSYLVSLESVIKRKFEISPGSTIIWNGDPLDAAININAVYSVRASPIDLIAGQSTGLSENEQSGYRQRFPFLVLLKLRGELLHPEISFEIQLPPEEKGILGGSVNAKLNMLNEDPSALNKQVFALLVLGRFIQENPLETESNSGLSTAARTTVGKFLSAQLNQLSSKVVPGVELNFDVQSYDDFQSGTAEGRTEVDIGVKKQLFDERLSVQVGGTVDVEGEKAKQNSASDITSDVTLEYKITKDGRYRLKAFRHNQYETIEGQLVETGAGVLYVRDFNGWKDFFRKPKKEKEPNKNSNEKITTK